LPEKTRQPGRIRAVLLALLVHGAFFGLIVFGVSWQNSPTPPAEVDLWRDIPPVVASRPAPTPAPEPPAPEPPKPEPPKPEPPKPEPPKPEPAKVEPPKPDPAIAERREREKKEKERLERVEREKKEKLERQKAEEAKKKREAEEAERKRKADEEKARQAKAKAEAEARAAAEAVASRQQAEIARFTDGIRAKIRGRANVPDTVTGKPEVQVRITILPGGEVLDIRIERPSGNRIYDEAIIRAIRSASPLPVPPPNSELFPRFRDLKLNIEHER
jgi:colicin import membrane protein